MQDMDQVLYKNLTQAQADSYGLVLTAYGLPYHVRISDSGWEIWVDGAICEKALYLIARYIEENPEFPMPNEQEVRKFEKTFTGVWVSLLLLLCHKAANLTDNIDKIVREYGSSAFDILNGEVYRTVTSLMLHSNYLHLAGNIAGITLFGTAVCNISGAGVGWLMILLSGIIGNFANAFLFKYGHISIGASTAVFGAIGILAAHQFFTKIKIAEQRKKAWLPLAGGLALLGFLGSEAHSDVTAHLFGFMAGICLGLLHVQYLNRFMEKRHQIYCMVVTISTIVFSWLWVL